LSVDEALRGSCRRLDWQVHVKVEEVQGSEGMTYNGQHGDKTPIEASLEVSGGRQSGIACGRREMEGIFSPFHMVLALFPVNVPG
jgi:hypothetical protein